MKLKARMIDKTATKRIIVQDEMHHCTENMKRSSSPPHAQKQEAEEIDYDWDYKRSFKEDIFELALKEWLGFQQIEIKNGGKRRLRWRI